VRPRPLAVGALLVGLLAFACSDDPGSLSGREDRSSGEGSEDEVDDTAPSASGSTANELCFNTINEYRKRDGLRPFERWSSVESCADGEAKSDAETRTPHGAFPRCGELAQNECPGNSGAAEKVLPACLAAMWREGKGGGHHDNMASTKYTKAACGVHTTSRGVTWSVQNFR
jgi:hypothetical protein